MRVAIIIFLVLGALFCYVGKRAESLDSPDASGGAIVPWIIGIAALSVALVLFLILLVIKAFS